MYIVDQPWLLTTVTKIVIGFMSEKLQKVVRYIKSTELPAIVDVRFIPTELKGEREKCICPTDVVPLDTLMDRFDLNEKFVDYFYKLYKLERTK